MGRTARGWLGAVLGAFLLMAAAFVLFCAVSPGRAHAEPRFRDSPGATTERDERPPDTTKTGARAKDDARLGDATADAGGSGEAVREVAESAHSLVREVVGIGEPVMRRADPVVDTAKSVLAPADPVVAAVESAASPVVEPLLGDQLTGSATVRPVRRPSEKSLPAPPARGRSPAPDGINRGGGNLAVVLSPRQRAAITQKSSSHTPEGGGRMPTGQVPVAPWHGAPTQLRPGGGSATPDDEATLVRVQWHPTLVEFSYYRGAAGSCSRTLQVSARPG